MIDITDSQHAQALVVSIAAVIADSVGMLDWAGPLVVKFGVTLLLAILTGFGYQLGRLAWSKLTGLKAEGK